MGDEPGVIGGKSCFIKIFIDDNKIEEWKKIYNEYIPLLKPNQKSNSEILNYIRSKYPVEEDTSSRVKKVIEMNILGNQYFERQLPILFSKY